jgi:hypothetical protein
MIQKFQNLFNTESKSGKFLFIFFTYLVFWFLAYGIWMVGIIPNRSDSSNLDLLYRLSPLYFFIVIPLLSFKLALFCRKVVKVSVGSAVVLNVIFLFVSLIFFIRYIISSFNFGGF